MKNLTLKLTKKIAVVILSISLFGCATAVHVQKSSRPGSNIAPQAMPKSEAEVSVFRSHQELSEMVYEQIGVVSVSDTGMSVGCGFDSVVSTLRKTAFNMGGNGVLITDIVYPSLRSTCHQMTASVLLIVSKNEADKVVADRLEDVLVKIGLFGFREKFNKKYGSFAFEKRIMNRVAASNPDAFSKSALEASVVRSIYTDSILLKEYSQLLSAQCHESKVNCQESRKFSDFSSLEEKCHKEDAKACLSRALQFEEIGLRSSYVEYLKKACALGNQGGCSLHSQEVSQMHNEKLLSQGNALLILQAAQLEEQRLHNAYQRWQTFYNSNRAILCSTRAKPDYVLGQYYLETDCR